MATPTREELKALRVKSMEKPPVNVPKPEPPQEIDEDEPVSPATPSHFPIPPVVPQKKEEALEDDLPAGSSAATKENWNRMKQRHQEQISSVKKELEEARQALNDALKTGTKAEQAVAKEEYEALQKEKADAQSKLAEYEAQLRLEREAKARYEEELKDSKGKLAKLSLDFDPDFQERYVKPLDTLQTRLSKKVKSLSDSREVADQVTSIIYSAVQQPDDEAFYATLRRIKDLDPDNYAMYTGDAQNMRDLLIERLQAMENHEKTAQQLRSESYRSRERTIPEASRKLMEVRQRIEQKEPELSTQLNSEPYKAFLRNVGVDPDQIERQLEESVREAHKTGELNDQILYFAAEGARKLQLAPTMMYMKDQLEKTTQENEKLKEQIDSLRGSTSVRPSANGAGRFEPLQPPRPSPQEVRRMTPKQLQEAKLAGMPR